MRGQGWGGRVGVGWDEKREEMEVGEKEKGASRWRGPCAGFRGGG